MDESILEFAEIVRKANVMLYYPERFETVGIFQMHILLNKVTLLYKTCKRMDLCN